MKVLVVLSKEGRNIKFKQKKYEKFKEKLFVSGQKD